MMISRWTTSLVALLAGGALIAGCGTAASPSAPSSSQPITLQETGSTLLYPLFQQWVSAYHQGHPGVKLNPAGTGSGTGISEAESGAVQIGASDAYMSTAQISAHPGILNIPLAISAQIIAYNVPGLNNRHLNISAAMLAGIYTGRIKYWNDAAIQAANPGVALPHAAIVPLRRNDASGDSFLFTQYMTRSAPAIWTAGYATSPAWPALPTEVGATGNGGMVQALSTPDTIAYVGISYLNEVEQKGYGYAALQNAAGHYVLPVKANIVSAAAAMVPSTPSSERISLIDAPGSDAYPIINYEYAIVQSAQPDKATASALRTFLNWAVSSSGGSQPQYLDAVHFLPLPASVVALSRAQISQIHG